MKDSIFQASSPIRHAAELLAINKRVNTKTYAFVTVFTDGGPDHNISFLNVIISWLAYFIINGCDSLVVARTSPTQSWTNPAERVMSVLNLALSNSALAREVMDDEFENHMKKCNSMASVRKMAARLEASVPRPPLPIPIDAHAVALDVPSASSIDAVTSSATAGIVDASADANDSSFFVATSGAAALDVPSTSSIDAVPSSATAGIVDAFADANASGFVVATSGATGKMSYERAF